MFYPMRAQHTLFETPAMRLTHARYNAAFAKAAYQFSPEDARRLAFLAWRLDTGRATC